VNYFRFFCLILCLVGLSQPLQAAEDYWGRSLTWPAVPQRILSLSPATTEMLYALGAEAQLVGVTHDCNYPPQASSKNQVGRFGQIRLETILKLKPDLILVTSDMGQALEPLRRLSVPVLAFKTPDVEAIQQNLLHLGRVTGKHAQAQQVVSQMQQSLKGLKPPTKALSVVYLVWDEPLMTASNHSFIGHILRLGGGQNPVQAQAPFVHYAQEALLKADPDVLILPSSLAAKIQLNRPPYDRLKAVKQKRILTIEDDLISRPGPRVIQAIQQIHTYLSSLKP